MIFEFIQVIVNSRKDEKYVVFDVFGNCELCEYFRRLEAKFSKVFVGSQSARILNFEGVHRTQHRAVCLLQAEYAI